MRGRVAEKLSDQVHEWSHRGLVDDELRELLTRRYDTDSSLRQVLLRWLGFFALFLLGSSLMSVIGMVTLALPDTLLVYVAPYAPPVLWGGIGVGLWLVGGRMATDPARRFPVSSHVLLTLGLIAGYAALSWAVSYAALFDETAFEDPYAFAGRVARFTQWPLAAAALYTGYRFGLRWPLGLGLLVAFIAVGTTAGMWGLGTYYFMSELPRRTVVAGAVVAALGVWHEEAVEKGGRGARYVGFGQVYVVAGLFFANMAAWDLSLLYTIPRAWGAPETVSTLVPVLLVMALRVMQIVLGARLHDGRFLGFGIVFLAIDLYTRFFEEFWDDESRGALFLAAGAAAMLVGALLERRARSLGLRAT